MRQRTWQLSDTLTWVRGSHQVKGGFTVLRRGLEFERTRFGKGFYFYSDFVATQATGRRWARPATRWPTCWWAVRQLATATGVPA